MQKVLSIKYKNVVVGVISFFQIFILKSDLHDYID